MTKCFLDVFRDELQTFYDVFKQDRVPKLSDVEIVRKPEAVKGVIKLNDHIY